MRHPFLKLDALSAEGESLRFVLCRFSLFFNVRWRKSCLASLEWYLSAKHGWSAIALSPLSVSIGAYLHGVPAHGSVSSLFLRSEDILRCWTMSISIRCSRLNNSGGEASRHHKWSIKDCMTAQSYWEERTRRTGSRIARRMGLIIWEC